MTLELNFTPPEQSLSIRETAKRNELIKWFLNEMDGSVTGLLVTGSMAYGYDYSVKESSDVDMQLLVTPETVNGLRSLNLFNPAELKKSISGYLDGSFSQFSLVFSRNEVSMECHFWDHEAFIDAITFETSETKRLRSGIDTPSTDHGFSFSRQESVKDYYGEMVGTYPVGVFPSYREENGVLYLCRPITNILGLPRVEKTNPALDDAMEKTWQLTAERLKLSVTDSTLDLEVTNIENTLPGKSKMRSDVLAAIRKRTTEELL